MGADRTRARQKGRERPNPYHCKGLSPKRIRPSRSLARPHIADTTIIDRTSAAPGYYTRHLAGIPPGYVSETSQRFDFYCPVWEVHQGQPWLHSGMSQSSRLNYREVGQAFVPFFSETSGKSKDSTLEFTGKPVLGQTSA